jgi:hypothetical protein
MRFDHPHDPSNRKRPWGVMAVHKLPAGLEILEGLEYLAEALGYTSAREHTVLGTGAAVDLAWFAAGDKRVPLMIFEVESTASASMANNAMKVFSQDVDDFVKPLFFFHVLLGGGPDNERIAGLRRTWGTYNYRVYRLNERMQIHRLVLDILGQHRRVNGALSLLRLDSALRQSVWTNVGIHEIFRSVEDLDFVVNYLGELAALSVGNPELRPILLDRLRAKHIEGNDYAGSYGSYLGQHFAGLLETSLLVGEETVADEQGANLLNTWQESSELGLRQIGPYFGLNRDYDEFIIGVAPLLFAVAAVVCRNQWRTKAWIVQELDGLIKGEDDAGVLAPYTSAARIWLLHVAASALRDLSSIPHGDHKTEYQLVEIFQRARTSVFSAKVPLGLLLSPPSPQELVGEDAEPLPIGDLSGTGPQIDHPEWTDISNGYFPEIGQDSWTAGEGTTIWRDTFALAISMLLDEDWFAWPMREVVGALHAGTLRGPG